MARRREGGPERGLGRDCSKRDGDAILRRNACVFGPGDLYCTMWGLLGLAGLDAADWTPQYHYWKRPAQLDDGGENVLD